MSIVANVGFPSSSSSASAGLAWYYSEVSGKHPKDTREKAPGQSERVCTFFAVDGSASFVASTVSAAVLFLDATAFLGLGCVDSAVGNAAMRPERLGGSASFSVVLVRGGMMVSVKEQKAPAVGQSNLYIWLHYLHDIRHIPLMSLSTW